MVLISFKNLKRYVKQREDAARLDEIERMKPQGYTNYMKRRVATLTERECDCHTHIVVGERKNTFRKGDLRLRLASPSEEDFSNIEQGLAREA